jgi:hypothetical protein
MTSALSTINGRLAFIVLIESRRAAGVKPVVYCELAKGLMTSPPDRNDLDYGSASSWPRTSKLAAGLPVLAFAACPCVVSVAIDRVRHMGVFIHLGGVDTHFVLFGFPIAVLILAIFVLVRVRQSSGRLLGLASAQFSIGLCMFWIFALAVLIFVLVPMFQVPAPG